MSVAEPESVATKTQTIRTLSELLAQGLADVDEGSAAHERLATTYDLFTFMADEMPKLVQRWHAGRQS